MAIQNRKTFFLKKKKKNLEKAQSLIRVNAQKKTQGEPKRFEINLSRGLSQALKRVEA